MTEECMRDTMDGAESTAGRLTRAASAQISALDHDLRTRFTRRTGSLSAFLQEWIRLDTSQDLLFNSRGNVGENYLQFCLANGDIAMALPLAQMCSFFAESTDAERIIEFLNVVDHQGNDIWHYLADNLKASEDDDSLEIAKILLKLEIDYSRKNANDESPLARLLIPEPRWQSVNSLMLAKQLTIEEIEESFSTQINQNAELKAEIMAGIFFSDMAENDGRLTQHLLYFAAHSKSERPQRISIAKALFDYAGGKRLETPLMRMAEGESKELFETALEFLTRVADELSMAQTAGDQQMAKINQQVFIYRRLARRNRVFQGMLAKAVAADRPANVSAILRLVRNEPLVMLKRGPSGQTERELVVLDKTSPAPSNPTLSLLLQQDARGNTPYHAAVIANRADCLRKLLFGLSLVDVHAILTRIPNRHNLTVLDLLSPKAAYEKLSGEIKAQRLTVEDAQAILANVKAGDTRIQEFLGEMIKKADDVIARTGGVKVAKPTFDLLRIPTVQFFLQQRQVAAGGAAPARPA